MKTIAVLILSLVAGVSLLSAEVLTDVGYPPPGGVTFVGTGDSGTTGANLSYTNFDLPPAFSALYWGPVEVDNVTNSNQGSTGQMSAPTFDGTSYIFNSTASWEGFNTRLVLTPHGLGTEGTELSLGASTTPSYPLFQVIGDYSVDVNFQAFVGGIWEGVDTAYNNLPPEDKINGVQDETNINFDFFTAPASAPEPGTFFLLGSGAVLMGLYRRRARR